MDHRHLLSWANRHLDGLEAAFYRFWQKQGSPLVTNYDAVTREQVVSYVPRTVEVDEEWIFRIGDVVHNLRVSLDYLAFRIITRLPNPPKSVKIAFPICYDLLKWPEIRGRRLGKTLPGNVENAFERLQPYHGGHTATLHPLALLDKFENVHKHRRLLSAAPAVTSVGHTASSDKVQVTMVNNPNGRTLSQRTELFRYRILNSLPTETDMKFRARESVCFCEPELGSPSGLLVVNVLKHIRNHVRDVVFPELEPFL